MYPLHPIYLQNICKMQHYHLVSIDDDNDDGKEDDDDGDYDDYDDDLSGS